MMGRDADRIHRIAFVRGDEAEYLNRNGKNELPSCCPHLECFHSRGQREDTSSWTACNISGCGCTTETPASRLALVMSAQDKAFDRALRRGIAETWFLCGMAVVGLAAAIHEVLR